MTPPRLRSGVSLFDDIDPSPNFDPRANSKRTKVEHGRTTVRLPPRNPPPLSPKKARERQVTLATCTNLTLLLPDDVMLLVMAYAHSSLLLILVDTHQVLLEASFDPKFAAVASLVCKRWRKLLSSDGFYRSVELLALTRSPALLPGHVPAFERLLARPQYRSVCNVSLRGIAPCSSLLRAMTQAFVALSCISFSGCTQLAAQPLLEVLPSAKSLRSLDFSSSSSSSRESSPLAPKWLLRILSAAPTLTSLDVQSCPEFTTESLKTLARVTRSSLTLLNISYTRAQVDSLSLFRALVHNTPEMREFYCCGVSLPCSSHSRDLDSGQQWAHLLTLSAGCQKNGHCLSPQVRILRRSEGSLTPPPPPTFISL